MRSFGSDNHSGIHSDVIHAMQEANTDHCVAYGNDATSQRAEKAFKSIFGDDTASYMLFNGTGANAVALQACLRSYQAVLCAETAHIQVDECGAIEKFTQSKLLTIPTSDGKLSVSALEKYLLAIGNTHHVQPRVISITNPTELGALYQLKEIKELSQWAHQHGMLLHLDGARLANACAALNCSLKMASKDCGVDILSFGGTKNGLMNAEAVIVFNSELKAGMPFIRKQGMQLASKMRFIAAQFLAYFQNDLWLRNAQAANRMAQNLSQRIHEIPQCKLSRKTEANSVFSIWPRPLIEAMQKKHYFYLWNEATNEIRLVCSFDTQESDIENFVADLKLLASKL
jgi:threonine aldolase